MSLVSTYVESQSGKWYKNPVVKGDGWYICWDDDEPIEIVIDEAKKLNVSDILDDLAAKGWCLTVESRPCRGARRLFDGDFKPAVSYYLRQAILGPTDEMLSDSEYIDYKPQDEGVFYYNSTNGNGGYDGDP